MLSSYEEFIHTKETKLNESGFEPDKLSSLLKPFQHDLTALAVRRGRCAIFASTGLGKTFMELSWADAIRKQTKKKVLIFNPLAVAFQTVGEAKKFGIKGVEYAESQNDIKSSIVISNYDRLERFDPSEFVGIVLDESSILKNLDGKTRNALIDSFSGTPYRLCATATPAPNDFTELGNHSEFLGVMSLKEMLSMYFVHDGGNLIDETSGFQGWRLKRHAKKEFWKWVSSWALIINHPRDIGYDDASYDLPKLIKHEIIVDEDAPYNKRSSGFLPVYAKSLQERIGARRDSTKSRAAAAAKLVEEKPDEPWLIWCGLNTESELITKMLPNAAEVRGSDQREYKISNLLGFCRGSPLQLVTKPKIAGFGMNWQHCNNLIFLGLNDSFEQMYQAIRRCWRFGQTKDVNVYVVMSAYEGSVLRNIERKERDHQFMINELCSLTNTWLRHNIKKEQPKAINNVPHEIELPSWL